MRMGIQELEAELREAGHTVERDYLFEGQELHETVLSAPVEHRPRPHDGRAGPCRWTHRHGLTGYAIRSVSQANR